ncbi:MAG: 50S ribosomal protein L20 [Candidatus Omnitrophica bacterium]|nr:50S ribosomal protein L20 [Candidatus Omnitrophota bacterium]
MPRARHGVTAHKKRRKYLKQAEGTWGGRHRLYTVARDTVKRSMAYATRDRKTRKRDFRRLWVVRINAACRAEGLSYSNFIKGLKEAKVSLDRKVLADIALHDAGAFQELVKTAKASL